VCGSASFPLVSLPVWDWFWLGFGLVVDWFWLGFGLVVAWFWLTGLAGWMASFFVYVYVVASLLIYSYMYIYI